MAEVDGAVDHPDRAGKATVHRIIAQQMGVGLDRPEIVDRDDLEVVAPALVDGPQNQPTDTAETVDRDANGHFS